MAEIKFSSVTPLFHSLATAGGEQRDLRPTFNKHREDTTVIRGSNCLSSIWEVIMVILEIEYEADIEKVLFFISQLLTFHDQSPCRNPKLNYRLLILCNVLFSYWIKIRNIMKLLHYQCLFLVGFAHLLFLPLIWCRVLIAFLESDLNSFSCWSCCSPRKKLFPKFWKCLPHCPSESTCVGTARTEVWSSTFPMKKSIPLSPSLPRYFLTFCVMSNMVRWGRSL